MNDALDPQYTLPAVIAIHSFRRGVGRSTLAANLAAWLAASGQRVGLIDADFSAPSLHLFFQTPENQIQFTLNDFLLQRCTIQQARLKLSRHLPAGSGGELWLVPASTRASDIVYMLRNPINFEQFNLGLRNLEQALRADQDFSVQTLIVDMPAGLSQDTLTIAAQATTLIVLLHPDQQEYQGTAVTVEVARSLGVPQLMVALNEMPTTYDFEQASQQLNKTYQPDVALVLPYSASLSALPVPQAWHASEDPFIESLNEIAAQIARV